MKSEGRLRIHPSVRGVVWILSDIAKVRVDRQVRQGKDGGIHPEDLTRVSGIAANKVKVSLRQKCQDLSACRKL